jgi:hypothetical protein
MRTETLKQAIEFILGAPRVQGYISKMESQPNQFVISKITAEVADYRKSIIRIHINFNERGNPNNFKEDVIIDVQGTTFGDFRVLGILPVEE